jgi:hypothetical protein
MRNRSAGTGARGGWAAASAVVALLAALPRAALAADSAFVYQLKETRLYAAPLDVKGYTVRTPTLIDTNWDPSAEIAIDGHELFFISEGNLYVRAIDGLSLGSRQLVDQGGWRGRIAVARPYVYLARSGFLLAVHLDDARVDSVTVVATLGASAEIAVWKGYLYVMDDDNLYAGELSDHGTFPKGFRTISLGGWYGRLAVRNYQIYQAVGDRLYASPIDDQDPKNDRPLGSQLLGEVDWSGKIAVSADPRWDLNNFIDDTFIQVPVVVPQVPDIHNLLANGSFELPNTGQSGSGWYTYGSTSSGDGLYRGASVPGWHIPQGNIDVKSSYWRAPKHYGYQSIDLAGNTPGTIEQTFPTVPGRTYLFSGLISHNPGIREGKADVYLNGKLLMNLSHRGSVTNTQMRWEFIPQKLFPAESDRTTLTITDRSGGVNQGIALDGLAITAQ